MTRADRASVVTRSDAEAAAVRVWDPFVRLFHWGLVAAFLTAWLTAEEVQPVHEMAGYVVACLVAWRLIWGLVGSRYARFSHFVKGPGPVLAYLSAMLRGSEGRYLGHNPIGGIMIVALLMTLSGTAFTGWLMADPARLSMLPDMPQIIAPASADDDGDNDGGGAESDGPLKEVHEALANLLLVLVALHVGGVVLASLRHRENLVLAMVSGNKRASAPGDVD